MSDTLNKSYVSVGEPLLQKGKLFFTIQPHNFTVTGPGQEVTFRGVAVGAFGYLWAWRPDPSAEWVVIEGEESDTFITTVSAGMNGWQFICVAFDAEDNYLESRIATITCTGLTEVSQEGAIVTIEQGPVELKSLVVNIEPVQEGSGDPSPDNIRPISGATQVDIFVAPTSDPDDPDKTTTTILLEQTVYGGSLEVKTGVLTVTHTLVDLGTLDWVYIASAGVFRVDIPTMLRRTILMCSQYTQDFSTQIENVADKTVWNYSYAFTPNNLVIKDSAYTDSASFKTAMDGVQLVYELATPITIQLTPVEVSTLLGLWGQNNIYASTGNVSVTYLDWPAAPEEIELNPQITPLNPLDIDPVLEPAVDDIQPIADDLQPMELDTLL